MNQQEQIRFDSNPMGLDKFFIKLKESLENIEVNCNDNGNITTLNLFDVDTIFLASKRYSDGDIFVREVYPIAKKTGDDSRDLRPNSDYKSTAFLYEHSPRVYVDNQTMVELDLSLVVSYQQDLLIPNLPHQMAEKIQLSILYALTNRYIDAKETTLYTNRDTVFTDFDINYFTQIFTNEFNHFRFRFKTKVSNDCYEGNITFVKDGDTCHN